MKEEEHKKTPESSDPATNQKLNPGFRRGVNSLFLCWNVRY